MKTFRKFLSLTGVLYVLAAVSCAPGGGAANGAAPSAAQGGGAPSGQQGGGRRSAEISVQAVEAAQGTLVSENSTAGTVNAVTQSQVASQVAGAVAKVYYKAGAFVSKGQVVVQLDDTQARMTLRNSQAALENAKINLSTAQDNNNKNDPKLQLQVRSAE